MWFVSLDSFHFLYHSLGTPVITCNETGDWFSQGNCIQRPFYYFGPIVVNVVDETGYKYFNLPSIITIGWKMCMYGSTTNKITRFGAEFKTNDGKNTVWLYIRDIENALHNENIFNVYNNNGNLEAEKPYGTLQNLSGLSNLNINYTLVNLTQFRVEVAPIGYSVTTEYVSSEVITLSTKIKVSANGLTINVMDCNCP